MRGNKIRIIECDEYYHFRCPRASKMFVYAGTSEVDHMRDVYSSTVAVGSQVRDMGYSNRH